MNAFIYKGIIGDLRRLVEGIPLSGRTVAYDTRELP